MSPHVLIVEDEPTQAQALALALGSQGCEVTVAHSGEQALEHTGADVLVADVGLPGIDGLELIARLRERGERPRAVVVSGRPDLEACRRALRLGAAEFLTKPVAVERIVVAALEASEPEAHQRHTTARFERTFAAAAGAVEEAPRELAAYAQRCAIGPAGRARIAGTCAELVENAVRHAYPSSPGSVQVAAEASRRELRLTVRDAGVGFDPLDRELDHLSDSSAGGLARAATLAEDVRIDSAPGSGTCVQASFCVLRTHFDEEEQVDLSELDWLSPETSRRLLTACSEHPEGASRFYLSPALAVCLGRLLAGPDPRRVLRTALWS